MKTKTTHNWKSKLTNPFPFIADFVPGLFLTNGNLCSSSTLLITYAILTSRSPFHRLYSKVPFRFSDPGHPGKTISRDVTPESSNKRMLAKFGGKTTRMFLKLPELFCSILFLFWWSLWEFVFNQKSKSFGKSKS